MSTNEHAEILTTNTSTEEKTFLGPVWLHLSDDFGGGAAQVTTRGGDGVVRDLTGGLFTAKADELLDFAPGSSNVLAISLSGATAPNLITNLKGSDR